MRPCHMLGMQLCHMLGMQRCHMLGMQLKRISPPTPPGAPHLGPLLQLVEGRLFLQVVDPGMSLL